MTTEVRISNVGIGEAVTIGTATGLGTNARGTVVPPGNPQFWWRADSGLTTSAWTAVAGGLNFTFTNVTSADSVNGVLFNGTTSEGVTTNVVSTFDVKHLLIRFDTLSKATNVVRSFLGGGETNTLTPVQYYNTPTGGTAGARWWTTAVEGGLITYSYYTTEDFGTSIVWVDFTNTSLLRPTWYSDNSETPYLTGNFNQGSAGTYTRYFRYASGFPIYIGRRLFAASPGYLSAYIKEVAMFTSDLSVGQVRQFRSEMLARWP